MVAALTDPFDDVHMAITPENLATRFNVSREEQDDFAKDGATHFVTDEHARADASHENMAKLKPVFSKTGTLTAGNASVINDAAAVVVLMDRQTAERRGLKPMGALVAYSHAAVDPDFSNKQAITPWRSQCPGLVVHRRHAQNRPASSCRICAVGICRDSLVSIAGELFIPLVHFRS